MHHHFAKGNAFEHIIVELLEDGIISGDFAIVSCWTIAVGFHVKTDCRRHSVPSSSTRLNHRCTCHLDPQSMMHKTLAIMPQLSAGAGFVDRIFQARSFLIVCIYSVIKVLFTPRPL